MNRRAPSRRGRTRWLMIAPLTGLAIIIGGVVALEAAAPTGEPIDWMVRDVPPLGIEDERQCLRLVDDQTATDIREEFAPGERVSSAQVFRCPSAFDDLEVSFAGEVIGDVLERRGGAWVQVNDDAYALETGPLTDHRMRSGFNQGMSVWLPDGLHERIGDVGNADRRGDVILVRGILDRTDPNDGGGITIRAEEMEILAPSIEVEAPFHTLQAAIAGILAVIALASVAWARRVARR
jgi:hypothetical protein